MLPLVSVHILLGGVRGSATGSHMGKMANYPDHMYMDHSVFEEMERIENVGQNTGHTTAQHHRYVVLGIGISPKYLYVLATTDLQIYCDWQSYGGNYGAHCLG